MNSPKAINVNSVLPPPERGDIQGFDIYIQYDISDPARTGVGEEAALRNNTL